MIHITNERLNEYFDKFDDLKLVIEYYADLKEGEQFRVEFMATDLATKVYTFKEFYNEYWSKGFTKHIETASLGDEQFLVEMFFKELGVETYLKKFQKSGDYIYN